MKLFFSRLLSSRRAIKRCIHECTEIFVAFYPRKNSASGIDELKSRYCVQRVIEIIALITVFFIVLFFFFLFFLFFLFFFHILTILPYAVFQIQFNSFVESGSKRARWISSLSKITFVVALYSVLVMNLTTLRENGISSETEFCSLSAEHLLLQFFKLFSLKNYVQRFYYKKWWIKNHSGPR